MKVFIMVEKYTNMFICVFDTYKTARESAWYKSSYIIVESEVIKSQAKCDYCIENLACSFCGNKP